jgi:5-(carboxyamino)imidazole ribonucleotide synthase
LGVVGVLAVELFEDQNGRLLVNELAMRPHNSGHVLTEQSVTSQFEQHLRAVSDIPLGSVELRAECGVMVNVFGSARIDDFSLVASDFPEVKFHSYQKPARPGRKAGHLVVTGEDPTVTLNRAQTALRALQGVSG